jgi:hypothetical protein
MEKVGKNRPRSSNLFQDIHDDETPWYFILCAEHVSLYLVIPYQISPVRIVVVSKKYACISYEGGSIM